LGTGQFYHCNSKVLIPGKLFLQKSLCSNNGNSIDPCWFPALMCSVCSNSFRKGNFMLCIVVVPCYSLNEDTVDFLSWLCLMSLAVASRNVTEPMTQMFDNDLPKILGELLYTYVDPPSGADGVNGVSQQLVIAIHDEGDDQSLHQ
jgi:hypothetical protein